MVLWRDSEAAGGVMGSHDLKGGEYMKYMQ